MNINYTGRQGDLPPVQQRKLDAKFAKLGKLIGREGDDKDAHVVLTTQRHLTKAEVTVNYMDRALVAVGSGTDPFAALMEAVEKAEQQILKIRAKRRDNFRVAKDKSEAPAPPVKTAAPKPAAPKVAAAKSKPKPKPAPVEYVDGDESADAQIFRVNHHESRKPMTVEEAMIAIGTRDYMVYRDADRDCISVLVRRKDGNFDLVES